MIMQIKTDKGIKDVNILDVTAENFIVPVGEEHLYHCRIEIKKFNPETGERVSRPRIQVFGRKFFATIGLHNLRQQGYTVDVLHDPTEWLKANKEKEAEAAKAQAEAAEAAKAEEMAKLREEIKAELMTELKAGKVAETVTDGKSDDKKTGK